MEKVYRVSIAITNNFWHASVHDQGAKNASRLGNWIFSIISGDSERECTGCTLSERPPERTEKDIPKVVSDDEWKPYPAPHFSKTLSNE